VAASALNAVYMASRCALLLGAGLSAMLIVPARTQAAPLANAQTVSPDRPQSGPVANTQTVTVGLRNDVVFTEYSPLSTSAELVRRVFSPLTALRINQEAARAGKTLRGQAINLANERFSIYVPAHPPPQGYSLLVFVPPWPRAEVPSQWIPPLDRHDMILVTPANSGNDASSVDRREPLALLAAQNVMAQYPVDPQHVYIGGFSGGSRVALRLALGYPDVFRGALLNAGSDPIGSADVSLPPAELFRQFQESAQLVYVTGERDDAHLIDDIHSRQSLEKWCVFDVATESEPRKEHELADVSAFSRSLDALFKGRQARQNKLLDCRARIDAELGAQLKQVEDAFARGETSAAKRLLDKIDSRYGGLAAPRSVELAGRSG
jgi:pimeloyl-ACP methyl ester carboxylesterase